MSYFSYCNLPKHRPRLLPVPHEITAANGTRIQPIGWVRKMPLYIKGIGTVYRPVYVLKGLSKQFIIGADTLKAEQLMLDCFGNLLDQKKVMVIAKEKKTLPPFTEMNIKAKLLH